MDEKAIRENAIKEFAKRLKEEKQSGGFIYSPRYDAYILSCECVEVKFIDELVKEMTESGM